ncbi:hypothetical protein [Paenibacillus illinoisensis]
MLDIWLVIKLLPAEWCRECRMPEETLCYAWINGGGNDDEYTGTAE